MHIYQFEKESINKIIEDNEIVIIAYCQNKLTISCLFYGILKKLNQILNENYIVGIIYESQINNNDIYPVICLYYKNILLKKVYGFKKLYKIIKELQLEKVA